MTASWHTLPLGCGGLILGFNIAPDGTIVCRSDVGNCYRWTGTTSTFTNPDHRWIPLLSYDSMGGANIRINTSLGFGAYELVIAPSQTTKFYMISNDLVCGNSFFVYYTTDSGAHWTQTNLSMNNAGSNASDWKGGGGKIIVDPVNPNVVYVGMPNSSGNTSSVYTTFNRSGGSDGATFSAATTDGSTPFPATTTGAGATAMVFDPSAGTVIVGGQTVTKRIIIPVAGVGIYESTDGGVSFTEVAQSTMGYGANISVYGAKIDANGVYYAIVSPNAGGIGTGVPWRYRSGTWANLSVATGWTFGASFIQFYCVPFVDNRAASAGYVSLGFGAGNGWEVGVTSTNANTADPNNIVWAQANQTTVKTGASYDTPWQNSGIGQGLNAFMNANAVGVDSSGLFIWCGDQAIWYTDKIPNLGTVETFTSFSISRGMECTIAMDVCDPPGCPFPVSASQDVGIMQGTLTAYPTNYYAPFQRMDCQKLEYCASDSSFVTAKVNTEHDLPATTGALSAYSTNYGQTGTWTPYANQPDPIYQGVVVGGISNGSGGSGHILDVTSVVSGSVLIGQSIDVTQQKITALGTGAPAPGSTGTYTLDFDAFVAPGTTLNLQLPTQSGQIVSTDHNKHVCTVMGLNAVSIPVFTTNATSGSNSWNFCSGLPASNWFQRDYISGPNSKPLTVGYGSDVGTVWAMQMVPGGTSILYQSTDSGATWSSTGATIATSITATCPFLYSLPSFPGELWLGIRQTGGSGSVYHWTAASGTWTAFSIPLPLTMSFCLGAPVTPGGYPIFYGIFYDGNSGPPVKFFLYKGTFSGGVLTWALFGGATGTSADLPAVAQLAEYSKVNASWNVYERVFIPNNGFSFFGDDPLVGSSNFVSTYGNKYGVFRSSPKRIPHA